MFMIAWMITKMLDGVWSAFVNVAKRVKERFPFAIYRKAYLAELQHKAHCLAILTKAYDDLDASALGIEVKRKEGRRQWQQ